MSWDMLIKVRLTNVPVQLSRLPTMAMICYVVHLRIGRAVAGKKDRAFNELCVAPETNMKRTQTLNVYFESPQAPDASERLLAAYEVLFDETHVGDNPFDATSSHPIMTHAESSAANQPDQTLAA
jgi:hypothetical protein